MNKQLDEHNEVHTRPSCDIYHTPNAETVKIKRYKLTRLVFANDRSFWAIWKTAEFEGKNRLQLIYKLTTAMSLSLFTKKEMKQMLIGWHKKHEYKIHYDSLDVIIADVDTFTLEVRRERSRIQTARHRTRRKLAGELDPSEKERDRKIKAEANRRYRESQKLKKLPRRGNLWVTASVSEP